MDILMHNLLSITLQASRCHLQPAGALWSDGRGGWWRWGGEGCRQRSWCQTGGRGGGHGWEELDTWFSQDIRRHSVNLLVLSEIYPFLGANKTILPPFFCHEQSLIEFWPEIQWLKNRIVESQKTIKFNLFLRKYHDNGHINQLSVDWIIDMCTRKVNTFVTVINNNITLNKSYWIEQYHSSVFWTSS